MNVSRKLKLFLIPQIATCMRSSEFRTKVVCQGQRRPIYCDQHRVAIYSASFGTERRGSVHCPQPPGVRLTDCHSSLTSEKMISWCQGKPSCELSADPELFTRSCPPDHNMYLTTKYTCGMYPSPDHNIYLTTKYTCVPKEILKERYASQVDEDYQQNMTEAPSAELEDPVEPSEMEARDVPSVDENGQERLILYLTLGVTVCLLVGLGFLVGRLCMRRKAKDAGPEPAPPGFTGFQRPDSELDLSMGRSTVGSGHITPPPHATVSFQPTLPSDPSRYHVPCRERERHSPVTYRTAPSDNYRTAYFGAGTGGYRENLIGEHSSAGSLHRGAGDSVRGRDPVYGRLTRPLVPELSDELRSAASSDSGDRQAASPFETLKRLDALERRRPCQTGSDSSYGYS
ncbi:hypothetical protein FJT64_006068 [Amphibalanus amphitrite]|uniref:SUEL-type lectin domain-containing protein n=1 Tax=Amphibalanus amphitrite TaxID=1232801 RepID=A0A6A4VU87_AMPAM|nr:hypothetical protein FJT64_006068 [Amphibalanus amphitrite]